MWQALVQVGSDGDRAMQLAGTTRPTTSCLCSYVRAEQHRIITHLHHGLMMAETQHALRDQRHMSVQAQQAQLLKPCMQSICAQKASGVLEAAKGQAGRTSSLVSPVMSTCSSSSSP